MLAFFFLKTLFLFFILQIGFLQKTDFFNTGYRFAHNGNVFLNIIYPNMLISNMYVCM